MSAPELAAYEAPLPVRSSIGLLDLVVFWTSVTSLVAVALLWWHHFTPMYAAGIGTIVVISVLGIGRVPIAWRLPRPTYFGGIVAIVGLGVRIDRYPHLIGGQDQGLYTNMAIGLQRTHSVFFVDRFRAELGEALRRVYDRYQISGVRLVDPVRSLATIDFYPLHPIWMSMFGAVLGDTRQTVSLLFFAALGIALAMEICRQLLPSSSVAPAIVAMFMAVNPALAFFAKFPVAETVAGAFALSGFAQLLRACGPSPTRVRIFHASASIASFGALCFVRFQLFLYLPFFLVLLLLAATPYFTRGTRWIVATVVLGSVLILQLSLMFYQGEQPVLYTVAMRSIAPHIHSYMIVAALLATIVVALAYLSLNRRGRWNALRRITDATLHHAGVLLVIAMIASIPSIVALYRTGELTPWTFRINPDGDRWIIRFHAIWRFILMVSPVGFITLLAMAAWTRIPRRVGAALVLLSLCWCGVLLQPYVPYLYYYGRYLASDVLVLGLILCAVVVAHLVATRHGFVAALVGGAIVAWSLPFAALQIGHVESERIGFADQLASRMGKDDVVVFSEQDDRTLLPLRVAYDKKVFVLPQFTTGDELAGFLMRDLFIETRNRGGRVLVADRRLLTSAGLQPEMSGTLQMGWITDTEHWRNDTFQTTAAQRLFLPTRIESTQEFWYVYEVDATYFDGLDCDGPISLAPPAPGSVANSGFVGFDANGQWMSDTSAVGCEIVNGIRPTVGVVTVSNALVTPDHTQRLVVSVDGMVVASADFAVDQTTASIEFKIPPGTSPTVVVSFSAPDATSPEALGTGQDGRLLGVAIASVTLSP